MKPKHYRLRFLTPGIAAAVLACAPLGAAEPEDTSRLKDQPAPQSQRDADLLTPKHSAASAQQQSYARLGMVEKASQVIGRDLLDSNHRALAEIEDLVIDLHSGKVVLAIVETEEDNLGASYRVIDPGALKTAAAGSYTVDREQLTGSPSINLANWRQALDSGTLAALRDKHGHGSFRSDRETSRVDVQDTDPSDAQDRQPVKGQEDATPQTRDNWGPPKGDAGFTRSSSTTYGTAGTTTGGSNLVRASEIIGEDLEDATGADLGRVKDLAVDMSSGRVVSAIVSTGGVLGIGDTLRVVPPATLQAREGADQVQFTASRAQFDRAIRMTGGAWPAYDEAYIGEVYRVFDMDPHGGRSGTTSPAIQDTPISPTEDRE